jgi:hypothetical protein
VYVRVYEAGQHHAVARLDDGTALGHFVEGCDGGDAAAGDVHRGRPARLRCDDALTPYDEVWRRHDENLKHKSARLATK